MIRQIKDAWKDLPPTRKLEIVSIAIGIIAIWVMYHLRK